MMGANDICAKAADLVSGNRQKTHGDKVENHQNIADLWNAYLGRRLGDGCEITPKDAALMMVLLKIARTKAGSFNIDDYVDMSGYAGVAGEIAVKQQEDDDDGDSPRHS